ncbi:MAG: hypothetical protein Q9182_000951 [Xanthomendoza sp. 2 TL-2023]
MDLPLTVTATELQELLAEGKVSTVDLVKCYLAQIENHNHNGARLNAIISTAPRDNVLRLAQTLDDERKVGKLRGPMHGIPIITPAGSSSGSAVGVAAGFAPVSIGAETNGSVVQPATSVALYGLKASHGSTAPGGVLPGVLSFDCLGGFAKTPADLAEESGIDRARSKIAHAGAYVISPVHLIQFFDLFEDLTGPSSIDDLIRYEFREEISNYLALYPDSPVKTLEDLVKFNEGHAELELLERKMVL